MRAPPSATIAVDGPEHRTFQHRGVDDEKHVEAGRQRVREVRHHCEIAGRAQLGEKRQSFASRLYRTRCDERTEHRDARRALAHQRAHRGRDVVFEKLSAIDVEIRHRQGAGPVAQLDAEEERIAARHRDPSHPGPEGGDLRLGVGARVTPVDDELPAA